MTDWLPEWLFEGSLTVYAALAVAAGFLLVVWKQTPRKAYLVGAGVLLALIGVYYLLDVLVQTDREKIAHAFEEMSVGVRTRDVNRIFAQVSDGYNRHGMNKAAFRQASASVIDGRHVDEVRIWGFEFPADYKKKESASDPRENSARVSFMAKPISNNQIGLYRVDAVMHRDADGQWRMQSWEVFDPYHESTSAQAVPGVP